MSGNIVKITKTLNAYKFMIILNINTAKGDVKEKNASKVPYKQY